ncbi:MAG: diguanylate cyclase [Actinomycetota bacterium]|nr:diguanylate cyclase [Actinomycetota bacterium]
MGRSDDTVVRLGGDKFAVLLAELTPGDAHHIADRMRAALAQPYWPYWPYWP